MAAANRDEEDFKCTDCDAVKSPDELQDELDEEDSPYDNQIKDLLRDEEFGKDGFEGKVGPLKIKCDAEDCSGVFEVNALVEACLVEVESSSPNDNDNSDEDISYHGPFVDFEIEDIEVLPSNETLEDEYDAESHDYICEDLDRFTEASEETFRLLIIAKTSMYKGRCYIGWDIAGKRLFRPIEKTSQGECCWSTGTEINVGEVYEFLIIKRHPNLIPNPHHQDDVLVMQFVPHEITLDMFDNLVTSASQRVSEIFHPGDIKKRKYIEENTLCQSAGIFKGKGRQLKIYSKANRNGIMKKRLKIREAKKMVYDFAITALDYAQSFGTDDDVLVVLGLGRPWDDNGKYNPKRCYILVIAIITK